MAQGIENRAVHTSFQVALAWRVGHYCFISETLNGVAIVVPEQWQDQDLLSAKRAPMAGEQFDIL
ncbi:hypothetical protein [Agrobacterium sp. B1(2019)]|uniref:hypothetical protein n=1 Tax=Agrobacterium sp. B1(2019) TaxID=2607032 RepID=UPI0011ED4819|nr:hypothetical protein [Agrobacterium sp. B1(2019)]TZG32254.1 hypothetical protein AGR1_25035 [Agrobacterium sp. B1(2019)]